MGGVLGSRVEEALGTQESRNSRVQKKEVFTASPRPYEARLLGPWYITQGPQDIIVP